MATPTSTMLKSPSSKLIFEKSNFTDTNSRHRHHIDNRYFNFAVDIMLPGNENLPKEVAEVVEDIPYWLVHQVPLHILTNIDFIEAFVKKGEMILLSHNTRIDKENCVALLPNGKLLLNIDKDTFEELGLEGKPSEFDNKKRPRKFVVIIDLCRRSFQPGKKFYERVRWCLTDRLGLTLDFLVSWIPHDDQICPSSISAYFQRHKLKCVECETKEKRFFLSSVPVPYIDSQHVQETSDTCGYLLFWEWLGAVACRINCTEGRADSFSNTFLCPQPAEEPRQCRLHRISGFISSTFLITMVNHLRDFIKTSDLPWCAVVVHGFMDSPVSWGTKEHGYHVNGDVVTAFVLFPNEDYWLYTALSTRDVLS